MKRRKIQGVPDLSQPYLFDVKLHATVRTSVWAAECNSNLYNGLDQPLPHVLESISREWTRSFFSSGLRQYLENNTVLGGSQHEGKARC
jgi:hypothetical protein